MKKIVSSFMTVVILTTCLVIPTSATGVPISTQPIKLSYSQNNIVANDQTDVYIVMFKPLNSKTLTPRLAQRLTQWLTENRVNWLMRKLNFTPIFVYNFLGGFAARLNQEQVNQLKSYSFVVSVDLDQPCYLD